MTAREDQAGIRTPREMAMGKPERNYSAITPKVGAQGAAPQHFESDLARCKNCGKVDNMHRPDGTCVAQPPQNALTADQYWESDPMWSKWPEHVTPEMVSQIRALMCLFAESYCALRARSTPSPELGKCQYWPVEPHPDCGCNYCHSQRESRLSQPTPSPDSPPQIVSAPDPKVASLEALHDWAHDTGSHASLSEGNAFIDGFDAGAKYASSSNAALQTQVDTLKQCWKQEEDGRAKEVSELRSEVDGLREALLNYGNHRIFCTMHVWLASTGEPTCNCGWEEVLARLGTESTEKGTK